METVAAYLLCIENGLEPTKEKMSEIIGCVNPGYSKESFELFLSKISGKTHAEIMAAGSEKMATQTVSTNAAAAPAEKVEEKVEEEEESDDAVLDMF
ncbi:RLA2 [Enterospora canceri]|uniref:RLA2 n=1 Tax=Enterospora canceri TaxID=1081671 RepID=A0A1Y1S3N7_9MICR|nr:RLA2 [Enterospora canceri]ORD92875.1 RLA2 [Enterospora canceri]